MEQLEEDLAQRGGKKGKANSENLPKGPARHELSGFRGVVTNVKFHPSISVIVASGEDGTVKVHIIRVAAFRIEALRRWRSSVSLRRVVWGCRSGTTRAATSSGPSADIPTRYRTSPSTLLET